MRKITQTITIVLFFTPIAAGSNYTLSLFFIPRFKSLRNISKLGRYCDKRLSFDSVQDDVTMSEVEVLSTLIFLYINIIIALPVADLH